MRKLLICLCCLNAVWLTAAVRGTTQAEIYPARGVSSADIRPHVANAKPAASQASTLSRDPSWQTVDSYTFNGYLSPEELTGVWSNASDPWCHVVGNIASLTEAARQAVAVSPAWLRPRLFNTLHQLTSSDQDRWAAIINQSFDPYIDEIAFCVAASSNLYLTSSYADPELFVENAFDIYDRDADLDYVTINDTGTTADDDYWSSTTYRYLNADGVESEISLPRDIYYWYVVFPKITDEIPAFINPASTENNTTHNDNIQDPPAGVFWRSWFWRLAEDDGPVLRDVMTGVSHLYNLNGENSDAVHAVSSWLTGNMAFDSDSERPHQPVRIFRKHQGRCGEWADMTAATARLCLIPCTSILSASCDHTWNEFWQGEWRQWEPVNGDYNHPLVYENGWGKVFGTVMEISPSGCLTPVTARYSEGCETINIYVKDQANNPIDGARVIFAIDVDGTITADMVMFTDANGLCSLTAGDSRSYYMLVQTSLGNQPADGNYAFLTTTTAGAEVSYDVVIPVTRNMPQPQPVTAPTAPEQFMRIQARLTAAQELIHGFATWEDIDTSTRHAYYYEETGRNGKAGLYAGNEDSMLYDQCCTLFDVYGLLNQSPGGTLNFNLPENDHWYMWASNTHSLNNSQQVEAVFDIQYYTTGTADDSVPVSGLKATNFPNPFNPVTTIEFTQPAAGRVRLEVYNVRGQKVRTLVDETSPAGTRQVVFNGLDQNGASLASGVYYYRLQTSGSTLTKKMLLLK